MLVDDLRLALQRETTADTKPPLHFFLTHEDYLTGLTAKQIRDGLIGVAEIVSHALEVVIAHHLHAELPVVIEGDGILPKLAAQTSFVGRESAGKVRSVFLVETDPEQLLSNAVVRGRGIEERSPAERRLHAESSALYGDWLALEARRLGLPVIESRPWETLLDRTQAATQR